MKIRRDDLVVVIAGNDKGSTPRKVIRLVEDGRRVVVQGVNIRKRHVKKGHPKSPQGGTLEVEQPIDISNVQLYCESCSKPSRVGYAYDDDGAKYRVCRKCDSRLNQISPPRAAYAKK